MKDGSANNSVLYRTFEEKMNKMVTVDMFDRQSETLYAYDSGRQNSSRATSFASADTEGNMIGLGLSKDNSKTYAIRVGDKTIDSGVQRLFGWHQFTLDFTSGTEAAAPDEIERLDVPVYDGPSSETLLELDFEDGKWHYNLDADWTNYLLSFKWKFDGWGNEDILGDKTYTVYIGEKAKIAEADPIAPVATNVGESPVLPAEQNVRFDDDTTGALPISWRMPHPSLYQKPGTFTLSGGVEGYDYPLSIEITVNGLISISALSDIKTQAGIQPQLPATVTAKYSDGERQRESAANNFERAKQEAKKSLDDENASEEAMKAVLDELLKAI